MSVPLPRGTAALGLPVVAEHPNGHRLVGTVRGCGPQGVILDSPPLQAGFLADADGWTFTTEPARLIFDGTGAIFDGTGAEGWYSTAQHDADGQHRICCAHAGLELPEG